MSCVRCLCPPVRPPVSLLSLRAYYTKQRQPSTIGGGGGGPPVAAIASAAQPFSTPLTPAPPKAATKLKNSIVSSVKAGTPLKNINYFKGKNDPVALEDSDYPEWLWALLDSKTSTAGFGGEEVGDLYSKSKKERKVAKKRAEKLAAHQFRDPEIRIPISEQTIDLPFTTSREHQFTRVVSAVGGVGGVGVSTPGAKGGAAKPMRPSTVEIGGEVQVSAEESLRGRMEVRAEMRKKSRAAIKEKNFLSTLGR